MAVPVVNPTHVPSIPSPSGTVESLQQSVLALKQNVEIAQGTRGTSKANTGKTPAEIALAVAISRAEGV